MRDAPRQRSTEPRWRCRRALAFAVVSSLIGALGHSILGGQAVDLRLPLLAVPVLAIYAWVFTDTRQRWWSITAAVALVQVGFHATMMVAAPGAHDMSSHAHAAGSHASTAAAAGGMTLGMLVAHAVAILIGVVVLLGIERRAWNVTKRVVRTVHSWFTPNVTVAPVVDFAPDTVATATCSRDRLAPATQWFVAACGFRGPPSVRFT